MTSRWPVRTGVLVDGGVAYFGAGVFPADTVYLYAVDAVTGKVLWKNDWLSERDANRNDLSPQGYLLSTKKTLFVPSGRTLPAAVDRATGRMLFKSRPSWRTTAGGPIGGSEAMLAGGQLYAVGEHHILALDESHGRTGFGWFLATRMTMNPKTAFMTNGKEILAVDHEKRAAASRKRHALELKRSDVIRKIAVHPAPKLLAEAKRREKTMKTARERAVKLKEAGKSGAPEYAAAMKTVGKTEAAYQDAAKNYEGVRTEFNKLQKLRKSLTAQIEELKKSAIRWSFPSKAESALILAGKTVVVGGEGEVLALDAETGKLLWKHAVDGEARGLAVSDGRLVVSTTKGSVICFAPKTDTRSNANVRSPAFRRKGKESGSVDEGGALSQDSSNSPSSRLPKPPEGGTANRGDLEAETNSDDEMSYQNKAEAILTASGVRRGYCLVLGAGQGQLAYELARQSDLVVFGVDTDAEAVAKGRGKLVDTGIYGTRVTLDAVPAGWKLPYPDYFANLVVADRLPPEFAAPVVVRCLKPVGGKICLAEASVPAWFAATGLPGSGEGKVSVREGFRILERGKLPGAGEWTQEYGSAANTSCGDDERVRGGLQVLWYGDPGPEKMVNRHGGAVAPVSINGRFFVENSGGVEAYDAYNGLLLWKFSNSGAKITWAKRNVNPGNMVATDKFLFVTNGAFCFQLDAATGRRIRKFLVPGADDSAVAARLRWTYVSLDANVLLGTSTEKAKLDSLWKKKGWLATASAPTDLLFAYDTRTGKLLWQYQGKSILYTAIAVGNGRVYFVDSALSPEQRAAFLRQDKKEFEKLRGEARKKAEERLKRIDLRLAVALDTRTGETLWSKPVDVTDCSNIGEGGGALTMMHANERLVLCGANANGHYWEQFLRGEFKLRRLVVLSAATGRKAWARDANYRTRPLIIGHEIIAEPWAYDLYTGERKTRPHPLTGDPSPWKFIRPGHHCGAISATRHMMFYRSWFTAYYDIDHDDGTRHFGGHRTGCWINSVPANGLVIVPEASAGCVCLFSLSATVVLEPKPQRDNWGVFAADGPMLPVRRMFLNLGAPGDRRDASGRLWLAWPRPSSRRGLEFSPGVVVKFGNGGRWEFESSRGMGDTGAAAPPWLFASGARNPRRCELTLRKSGSAAVRYRLKLMFAAKEGFDPAGIAVKFQGKPAHPASVESIDGGVMMTFDGIPVRDKLGIDFSAKPGMPCFLSGVVVEEEGGR